MSVAFVVVAIIAGIALVSYLAGNPRFWSLAAKHPDLAYDWFNSEECWVVLESQTDNAPPRRDYTGPFSLYVPRLGRTVRVYGLADKIKESQTRFQAHVGDP